MDEFADVGGSRMTHGRHLNGGNVAIHLVFQRKHPCTWATSKPVKLLLIYPQMTKFQESWAVCIHSELQFCSGWAAVRSVISPKKFSPQMEDSVLKRGKVSCMVLEDKSLGWAVPTSLCCSSVSFKRQEQAVDCLQKKGKHGHWLPHEKNFEEHGPLEGCHTFVFHLWQLAMTKMLPENKL